MMRSAGKYGNKRLRFRGAGGRFVQPFVQANACPSCEGFLVTGILNPADTFGDPRDFNTPRCLNPACPDFDAEAASWEAERTREAAAEEEAQRGRFWGALLGER